MLWLERWDTELARVASSSTYCIALRRNILQLLLCFLLYWCFKYFWPPKTSLPYRIETISEDTRHDYWQLTLTEIIVNVVAVGGDDESHDDDDDGDDDDDDDDDYDDDDDDDDDDDGDDDDDDDYDDDDDDDADDDDDGDDA